MSLLTASPDVAPTPMTNRGVYPLPEWGECRFDYYRATVAVTSVQNMLSVLCADLDPTGDLRFTPEPKPPVAYYSQHVALTDRLGREACSVFWGGQNAQPNVEAKGSQAPALSAILRANWEHLPSRVDPMRQASREGLFRDVRTVAFAVAEKHRLDPPKEHCNNHPDKGDTLYLGSRKSAVCIRVYQPGLKRAEEEGRTGCEISDEERYAVRCELEFKPQKRTAKLAAASLSPDALWGVSGYAADFAAEVFAMQVQPVSISERRESNRNRALRFMASQYRTHLADLLQECQGDVSEFGSIILDLADVPHRH